MNLFNMVIYNKTEDYGFPKSIQWSCGLLQAVKATS